MEMLLIYAVCFATQGAAPKVQYSHVRLPVHGTIHKGALHGFFGKKEDDWGLYAIPTNNPSADRSTVYWPHAYMGGFGNSFRHNIQGNSIWISNQPGFIHRLKLADLKLYKWENWEAFSEKYPGLTPPHLITSLTLYDKYRKIAEEELGLNWSLRGYPTDVLGYGSVPASDNSVKSYILPKKTKEFEIWDSHFRWDEKTKGWKTMPSARFEKIGQWVADLDSSDFQKRAKACDELEKLGDLAEPALNKLLASKPALETCRRAELLLEKIASGESKAEGLLEDADNYEKFPSLFAEDFYFFLRKNDYYFVTESGKLYHAPTPTKGEKARTMKALWDDAKRPIVAVIEGADNDKVWLFAKDKNAGAKLDHYFEMKDTIRTETFDPTKLRPVNVEGRAKTLLEYLPLISADPKK
jgi:hypothetical protein